MIIAKDIDSFIATFPAETQKLLQQVRETIKKAAPEAEETINYGIPTFKLNGNLVHFSGYKNHIGFYPGGAGIKAFEKEISVYKSAKGSIQFPIDQPMPLDLISKITKYRVIQNLDKAKTQKTGNKKMEENNFSFLSAPAQRALANKGIKNLKELATYSQAKILKLHGMGPGSIPKLKAALENEGLTFKN